MHVYCAVKHKNSQTGWRVAAQNMSVVGQVMKHQNATRDRTGKLWSWVKYTASRYSFSLLGSHRKHLPDMREESFVGRSVHCSRCGVTEKEARAAFRQFMKLM